MATTDSAVCPLHNSNIVNPLCDSEGAEGLTVFYWSKFSAPDDVATAIRSSSLERLQRRLPGSNKVLRDSRNEQRYYMEQDDNMLHLLGTCSHCSLHTYSACTLTTQICPCESCKHSHYISNRNK